MSIADRFPTEKVILHKLNGEVITDIDALCQPDMVFVEKPDLLIEEGDYFERTVAQGAKQFYRVIEPGFHRGLHGAISDHYQSQVTKATESEMVDAIKAQNEAPREDTMDMDTNELPHKVFISHSSQDKDYMQAFVELLEDIGMPDGSIVCTSVPGHGIPGGARTFDWLREQFLQCELRVIFALSKNYYNSPACLNEMGAAWITKATDTLLLLPGFGFNEIRGCIDSTEIGIKLDSDLDELKHRLNEFKDTLLLEHALPPITQARWERHRARFISTVQDISKRIRMTSPSAPYDDPHVTPKTQNVALGVEAGVMLIYAAKTNGQILYAETLSSTSITAGDEVMNQSESPKEIAVWVDAIEQLLSNRCIERVGRRDKIYKVTKYGYDIAERFIADNDLDTSKPVQDVLKEFED